MDNDRHGNPPQHRHILWLVLALLLLFLLSSGTRWLLFGPPTWSGSEPLWRFIIQLTIDSESRDATVQIFPPLDTTRLRVVERTLHHPGFRLRDRTDKLEARRSIFAQTVSRGRKSISAEFVIHQLPQGRQPVPIRKQSLDTDRRERYLQDDAWLQLSSEPVRQHLQSLVRQYAGRDQLIEGIFHHVRSFAIAQGGNKSDVTAVLASRQATVRDRALTLVALYRAAGYPARVVTGVVLNDADRPRLHYWTEVYHDSGWLAYDAQYGYRESVPANYLPLRRNATEVVKVSRARLLRLSYQLEYEPEYIPEHENNHRLVNILDLQRLPLDTRNELSILLLLPLGALLTALFRHLVGVHSYGVFTPTLLALALIYTDLITTTVVFTVTCLLAVAGRSLFPKSLHRIPRLSIILTLVAVILALSVSVMAHFGLNQGGKVILLPIIILTSLIDRLYRTLEKNGPGIAMRRLVWTVLIALMCLPVMQFDTLGHFLVHYPETHFLTLAMFLWVSTYTGKRLVNLPLVRLLGEPDFSQNSHKKRNADDAP